MLAASKQQAGMPDYDLAIVGGGLSGAALAWQILRTAARPLDMRIIERQEALGAGVAYRTSHPGHRLNVRTRAMSLDPDDKSLGADPLEGPEANVPAAAALGRAR